MSRMYDNWERLVGATLDRERLRELGLADSADTSFSSVQSDFIKSRMLNDPEYYDEPSNCPFPIQHFSFEELKEATENFRSDLQIGEGGFGNVYKGRIKVTASKPGDGIAIAVKKWNPNAEQGRTEFLKEIHYMKWLHHPNLIKLVGFSFEVDKMLLAYEFMPNRSLQDHLLRRIPAETLSWDTRIYIAVGAARGLCFLHDGQVQLIHQNISSSNILLDKEFNAKLSDFGIAKAVQVRAKTLSSAQDMDIFLQNMLPQGNCQLKVMCTALGWFCLSCYLGIVLLSNRTWFVGRNLTLLTKENCFRSWTQS